MNIQKGYHVMYLAQHRRVLVFDGPSLDAICVEEIPNRQLSAEDGTLRLFVETEARKRGLTAVLHQNVDYAFDIV